MVWVVSECAYGAEITEVVGVAVTEERARQMASEHHDEGRDPKRVGPLEWTDAGSQYRDHRSRRLFHDPYLVEEFPIVE